MKNLNLFARISKIDEAKREVWGVAVAEVPDKAREIFDYDSSRPHFEKWSADVSDDTDGASLGNLRAMHGNVAAGKLISLDFDDVAKQINVGTKIVDDNEWQKVLEGVYTGFSIGGKYVKKWADGGLSRYTANPTELSLVDRPCVPVAKFYDVIKSDGSVEQKAFKAPKALEQLKKYSGEQVFDAGMALEALSTIMYIYGKESEEAAEYPDQVAALETVIANLKAFIASEIQEPDGSADSGIIAMAEKTLDLKKSGAEISAKNKDKAQAIHDHAVSLGAQCSPDAGKAEGSDDDLHKLEDLQKSITALTDENDTLKKSVATVTEELEKIKAEPVPAKAILKAVAVTKEADGSGFESYDACVIKDERGQINEAASLMKAVRRGLA